MESSGLVIIGAGGHGREAVSVALAACAPGVLLGMLDDGEPDRDALSALGVAHLGGVDWLGDLREPPDFVAAIGYPEPRRSVATRAQKSGAKAGTLVHPSAVIGPDVQLAPGVVVWPLVAVTTRVIIGNHSHLNTGSSVSHDSRLGAFVTVGPGARICGGVVIEDDVWIGAGATVTQGVRVGRASVLGAGSVVLRDVRAGETVVGVPGRPLQS